MFVSKTGKSWKTTIPSPDPELKLIRVEKNSDTTTYLIVSHPELIDGEMISVINYYGLLSEDSIIPEENGLFWGKMVAKEGQPRKIWRLYSKAN